MSRIHTWWLAGSVFLSASIPCGLSYGEDMHGMAGRPSIDGAGTPEPVTWNGRVEGERISAPLPSYRAPRGALGIASTFTVTTANDTGNGSLRKAISDANANPGRDLIVFNISGGGVPTINLHSALPAIVDPVVINGSTPFGVPGVELNGTLAGAASGIVIAAGNCVIQGMVINNFYNSGIEVVSGSAGGNAIRGNYIGVNATATAVLPNGGNGILDFAPFDTIGGTTTDARNIISGNQLPGIYLGSTAIRSIIQGNYIGTDVTGTIGLGNIENGINVDNASSVLIGGTTQSARNIISGNGFPGIYLIGVSCTSDTVEGNYIGTDVNGTTAIPNGNGLVIDGAPDNVVGGTTPGARNVISGNAFPGLVIVNSGATGNRVFGNFVGITANGTSALPNPKGILINNAAGNIVGGMTPAERNVISGNSGFGMETRGAATGNVFSGNFIGTDSSGTADLGNGSYGILINSSSDTVGGVSPLAGNLIAYNHGAGVYDSSGTGNLIRMNSIFSNYGGFGIDLAPKGLARNDSLDGDTGPNSLQNFPLLDSATVTGASTTIHGRFNSLPGGTFDIDLYTNATYDSSHFGEGQTYLGSTTVTTNTAGNAALNVTLPVAVPTNQFITATATDRSSGNTSEFSQCLCLSDSDGDGIMDSWETQGWGIDVNSDSLIDLDLYALGARKDHKDLFLEVDAMTGLVPQQAALDTVVASFARVPNSLIHNPDGSNGIHLHIDPLDDDTSIAVADFPNKFTDFDAVKSNYFGLKSQRTSPNARYILEAKNLVYRYCIFARTYGVGADTGSSGLAELAGGLGGNDFMATLGSTGPSGWNGGRMVDQAGTLMHEMGHTLGLWHGGKNNQNYKPNYYSVMNYAWQTVFPWQPPGSWTLNYSTDSLQTLNEASLNEPVGLNPPGPYVPYRVVAVPFSDSANNVHWARMKHGAAVDWTGNGDSTRTSVAVDINAYAGTSSPNEALNGYADWPNLAYNFRNSPDFAPGVHTGVATQEEPEMTREVFNILTNLPPPRPVGRFLLDGLLDTTASLLSSNGGISLYAALRGSQLYVATSSAQSTGSDMFIFVTILPGGLRAAPLGKSGRVAGWSAFLENSSTNNTAAWYDASGSVMNTISVDSAGSSILEGVVDLEFLAGLAPSSVYIAVGRYQPGLNGALIAQVPAGNGDGNIDAAEFYQLDAPLPIQLASFTATPLSNGHVRLNWVTLSETNNYGFEVQRKQNGTTEYGTVPNSFVPGHGTTIEPHSYAFTDTTVTSGQWWYRLRQIDLDGTLHYGPEVQVSTLTGITENSLPGEFALHQNYPNPFNPSTTIRFDVPVAAHVTLKVFNILGQEVMTLVDGLETPGFKSVEMNASHLGSGVYFFRLEADGFVSTRRMLLVK